jgi:predicted Zn-dependent protease
VTNCNFQVHYEDDPDFNAYASEGNNIHINRGLLDRLASEEEIAAVIAHEMGHHIAQHIEETQENALIGALIGAALAGAVLATGDNDPGTTQRVIGSSMAAGGMIGALSFSKEQEREADLISAYMLARAGYDLRKAGRLFTVLSRIDPDKERASLFDTHPAGPERVAAWEKAIAEVEASPDKFPREQ